jgi:hypothetical protein
MEPQQIEPLLIDYALGAASPEVSTLIEAFQAIDVDLKSRINQLRQLTELARQAIPAYQTLTVPLFPHRQLQSARRLSQWRRRAVRIAALAACLLLGISIGNRLRSPAMTSATTATALLSSTSTTAAPADAVPVAAVDDFCSYSRFLAVTQRNVDRPAHSQPAWHSFNDLSLLFHPLGG